MTKEKVSIFVVLSLLIFLLTFGFSAGGQNEEGQTTYVVGEIVLLGNEETEDKEILKELDLEEGDSVSEGDLEEKISAVRDMGLFESVESSTELSDGKLNLELELTEYPVLKKYEFTGVNLINKGKLKKALKNSGIKKGEVINKNELNEGLKGIQEEYEKKGYPFVSIGNINIDATLSVEVID